MAEAPRQDATVSLAASGGQSLSWVWPAAAAIVSGGLMAACYWPLHWHFLAWIALVPWLVVLPRLPADRAWLYGLLVGLVFYRIGVAWLCGIHGLLGAVAITILSLWMGFSFRVAKLLIDRFSVRAMVWAVPLAFVGQEVLRCEGLPRLRFGFLALGYSQSENLWIAQIASVGGVYLITLLLVTGNAAVAYALIRRRVWAWGPVAATVAVTVGLGLAAQPEEPAPGAAAQIACVQVEAGTPDEYVGMAREAAEQITKPAFIVLPEHAIDDYADERHPIVRGLAAVAREYDTTICIGAHIRAAEGAACDYDNVALLIGPDGRTAGRQAKMVPLPFFQDGNPGRRQEIFDSRNGRYGVCICYDADFTDVPRRLAAKGAELLLVPVMNAADWPVGQRWQQAEMARFRSIETRRWAVRAASSGISQVVGPDGRTRGQRTQEEGRGLLCGDVNFQREQTAFVRGGHLLAPTIGVLFLVVVAWLTAVDWRGKLRARAGRTGSGQHSIRAAANGTTAKE